MATVTAVGSIFLIKIINLIGINDSLAAAVKEHPPRDIAPSRGAGRPEGLC